MKRAFSSGVLALGLAIAVCAGCTSAKSRADIVPKADQILREASRLLATTGEYGFKANIAVDRALDDGSLIRITRTSIIGIRRPDNLLLVANSAGTPVRAWYDGATFSLYDDENDVYARMEAPRDIDSLAALLEEKLNMTLPLVDLIVSNPYERLTGRVLVGDYLGQDDVGEHTCHHLIFQQEFIDWEMWIDCGDPPLPRKLVITYIAEEGEPQYMANVEAWNLSPDFSDDDFAFTPPEDAVESDMVELLKRRKGN